MGILQSSEELRAEMDLQALKEAEEVQRDPSRRQAARRVARQKAEELMRFADDGGEGESVLREGFRRIG